MLFALNCNDSSISFVKDVNIFPLNCPTVTAEKEDMKDGPRFVVCQKNGPLFLFFSLLIIRKKSNILRAGARAVLIERFMRA